MKIALFCCRHLGRNIRGLKFLADMLSMMEVIFFFVGYLNVEGTYTSGVLSDMGGFFSDLQAKIKTLEEIHEQQKENVNFFGKDFVLRETQGNGFRQSGRPSENIKKFIDYSDRQNFRTSNLYDPNLLWTGIGKKR